MPLSTFTSVATIGERSEATPGLFNRIFSIVSQNVDQLNIDALSVRTGVSSNTLRPESGSTVRFLPLATYVIQQSVDSGGQLLDVRAYNAVGDGATDNTTTFQNCLNDAVVLGRTMFIPPGNWRCGTITDSSQSRLAIMGATGATIQSTDTIWLRVQPSSAKSGIKLRDLWFAPASGNTVMSPQILIRGTAANGGITEIDLDHLTFRGANLLFDCIHLAGCFNGRVANIFGNSLFSSRGIMYEAGGLNSGNIHFDTIQLANCSAPLGLSGTFNIVGGGSLLNQVLVSNHKATGSSFFNDVTLTSSVATSTSTLSLAAADVTSINTGDWVVCADTNAFQDLIRIRSKTSATMVQLERAVPGTIASGTTLGVGTFGVVIGANTRGIQLDTPHAEQVGVGVYCATSQQVQINNLIAGGGVRRGVVCTHGAQNTKVLYPIYANSLTTLILLEATASGSNTNNTVREPAGYGTGAGLLSFLSDGQAETGNNRYLSAPDAAVRLAVGTALAPPLAINSELSLGIYRSGVSTLALSYGSFNINQARTVSMRTLAASSLTPSAANTNTIANECGFVIGGASGASFWINSGGTTYIFNSAISAANA